MYCNICGKEIADGSKFCSNCGNQVVTNMADNANVQTPSAPGTSDAQTSYTTPAASDDVKPSSSRKPAEADSDVNAPDAHRVRSFEQIDWNVEDYPDGESEKTEDIDFDWNADPREIPDTPARRGGGSGQGSLTSDDFEADILKHTQSNAPAAAPTAEDEKNLSAADRIDKFYTFNSKNEEFQKILNKEYDNVSGGNSIESELSQADEYVEKSFDSRLENSSMEEFLKNEGVDRPYEPKNFESDVLKRIDAQDAAKEAKQMEEEARMATMEAARQAEVEAKRKAEEDAARMAAEAESRRRSEEEANRVAAAAREQALEEAKAEEDAKLKAMEEARLRSEEEAQRRLEEEARLRSEAEAKVKEAEAARQKAEADLKAAQEAAKIKAQQEARTVAEAEAQLKAKQEKEKLEAAEAQRRLESQRQKIADEANQAVAEKEVREVLEQTVRMKDEEAAKIKAAVTAMRDGIDNNIKEETPQSDISEAHEATRNQINEMTRARASYFAEDENGTEPAQEPVPETAASAGDYVVTGRATMLGDNDIDHTKTINKEQLRSGLNGDTIVAPARNTAAPENDEDFFNSLEEADTSNVADQGASGVGTAAGVAAAASGVAAASAANAAAAENEAAAQPMDFRMGAGGADQNGTEDDLLSQFESVHDMDTDANTGAGTFDDYNTIHADTAQQQENNMDRTIQAGSEFRESISANGAEQATTDTVVMPRSNKFSEAAAANEFDNYGNAEAQDYINRQKAEEENNAMDSFYEGGPDDEDTSQLSRRELRQRAKEQKRLEKEKEKEAAIIEKRDADFDNVKTEEVGEEKQSGKGRLVLRIILIVLIVILVIEIAGMAVRFIAPQSRGAEFIDTQLNKVIHLFTGEESTDNGIVSAQTVKVTMDDNVNNDIEPIIYQSDLA